MEILDKKNANHAKPLIAVVGATASGKSALAMHLAESADGEIINTDSMQVYRHFDIGTAKPSRQDLMRVPHHLIDVCEPDEGFSAARYVECTQRVISEIRQRGRVPILCGGTGLYFRALLQGLADIPPVPAEVREAVWRQIDEKGPNHCHQELALMDPCTAEKTHPNDAIRIARALEVIRATGKPLSHYLREQPYRGEIVDVLQVGYQWERAELHQRINERVARMLEQGWIAEVKGILERGYSTELKPFMAIGYGEIVAMLQGETAQSDLEVLIAARTRQYAKRQLTWFRKHPGIAWEAPGNGQAVLQRVEAYLEGFRGALEDI